MAISLALLPGSTIRWHDRYYVIVDYTGLDEIIAREPGDPLSNSPSINGPHAFLAEKSVR